MRIRTLLTAFLTLGLAHVSVALAQAPTISDAECQSLRVRLTEHARLSEGVRKAVASQAAAAPAVAPAANNPPATPSQVLPGLTAGASLVLPSQ